MSATAVDTVPEAPEKTYRMRLVNTEFLSEFEGRGGPRLPAGSVVDVDANTAVRWLGRNIAVYAKRGEVALKDVQRARLLARLEALDAEDDDAEEETAKLAVRPTAAQGTVRPTSKRSHHRAIPYAGPVAPPIETDDGPSTDASEED